MELGCSGIRFTDGRLAFQSLSRAGSLKTGKKLGPLQWRETDCTSSWIVEWIRHHCSVYLPLEFKKWKTVQEMSTEVFIVELDL